MQVDFAFGKRGLRASLPPGFDYQLLEARSAQPLPDASSALAAALESPIHSSSVRAIAQGKSSAAISVCDITRPAPNRLVLPPVLMQLEAAGIPRDRVKILIATGLHRPATDAEIAEIIGPDLYGKVRVVNHFAKDLSSHRHLGQTSTGTPVYIDEQFVAADVHITLGFIEPHLMLGFSGGRKLIAPGLAAAETIKVLHSPKFMRDPRSVEGSIADNPLHRELLEIARMARHDFMIDVALTRKREIAAVFAGEPEAAHRAGTDFVGRTMLETIDSPADAVITTAAGYPLDLTFYQTVKGITAASHVVRDGGRILVLSECAEGAGAPEFQELMRRFPRDREFLDFLAGAPVTVDQWQLEKLAMVSTRKEILYHTPGLPSEFHNGLWGRYVPSFEAGVAALMDGLRPGARVIVIPEGPYVLARVEEPVAV